MYYEKFSFSKLEEELGKTEAVEEKIVKISYEMMRCKEANQDIKDEMKNSSDLEIKFTAKLNSGVNKLVEVLDRDKEIKNEVTRSLVFFCGEKLLEHNKEFLKRAQILMDHFKTLLELETKFSHQPGTNQRSNNEPEATERIIWRSRKEKLLELFEVLYQNEFIPKYSKEEIFGHFANEKQIPFYAGIGEVKQFCWKDSDCRFAVLVDELAKQGVIDDENKFKIFTCHFVNKRNKPFKGLAQKRNYTENFTKTGSLIREILKSIGLTAQIISFIIFYVMLC